MLANKLIERSFKLELDVTRKHCVVQINGLEEGCYQWCIVDLTAHEISKDVVILNNQDSFSIRLDDIIPGQYILSISAEGQGTRHLKLVV